MPHSDRKPPEESDIDVQYGDEVRSVWYTDDEWYGYDGRGEFKLSRGSKTPVTEEEVGYEPCNCVVKYTFDRYGERRFCTGPVVGPGDTTCKHHRSRATKGYLNGGKRLMESGAYAKSRKQVFRYMEPYEKILVNDLYRSLVEMSTYDFDTENYELSVSVEDSDDFEGDEITLKHPLPTANEHEFRCKALWYAALDFVTMGKMRTERFRTAFEQSRDPSVEADSLTPGERWTVVASGEQGAVYDRDEHHLNLPLSRMQKDYDKELKIGGVEIEQETESGDVDERDYHLTIIDESDDDADYAVAEKHPDDASPLEDVEPPDDVSEH